MSAPVAVFQKTHGLTKFSVHSETGYLTKDETDKISSRLESASTHSRSLYVLELLLLLFVIVGVLIVGGVDAHNEWQPVPGSGKPVSPLFIATYVLGGLLMICLVLYCLGYRIDKDLKAVIKELNQEYQDRLNFESEHMIRREDQEDVTDVIVRAYLVGKV